jgi:phosphate transport system permease protein
MPAPTTHPPQAAPPVSRSAILRRGSRRVKLADRAASYVIRCGGALVILAVAAIFVFIGKETVPLFLPAQARLHSESPAQLPGFQAAPALLGTDEYEMFAYAVSSQGTVQFWKLPGCSPHQVLPLTKAGGRALTAFYRSPSRDHLYLGTADGQVLLASVKFRRVYDEHGASSFQISLEEQTLVAISPAGSSIVRIFGRHDGNGVAHFAALAADGFLALGKWEPGEEARVERVLGLPEKAEVTGLALDAEGRKLFASTRDGRLFHWYSEDSLEKPYAVIQAGGAERFVSALDLAIGDVSLLLGFNDGSIEQWFGVRESQEGMFRAYRKIRSFRALPAAVTHLHPSSRDKGFVAGSADGTLRLLHCTSGRTLLELTLPGPPAALAYSPKLTGLLAVTQSGQGCFWKVECRHPEISLKTLFGKVWYEGYDKPDYVWQSTGGSDDFEPKLSLTPLVFGTLKGALYGLFLAIPLAVLAALYTSQFMSWRLRAVVKPAVEIMAALPSVVIGFLAGLWLAPLLERHVLSIATMIVIVPLFVLLAVLAWSRIPLERRSRLPAGADLVAIALTVIGAFLICLQVGPRLEDWLFQGDLRQWVFNVTGHQFEQRNSIVIGFAMGFAVIPIIFTISEDALANVPQHFVSGSLALGASRWQTAVRIILPTASPGIFSAIMVGFGRAVGETMIVLMATGNTPILSLSPFNGMRTLSANIAVEIPEAPLGGTLYRVLFLTAILLFLMTFMVNTVAELIRQRLREKYKAV